MSGNNYRPTIDTQTAFMLIKQQQKIAKDQFLKSISQYIPNNAQEQPEQLIPFRQFLYSNTLLSGNEGEIKLQTLMKNAHPSVRYDTNIPTILKDFAKIYLQEVLQKSQQLMTKRKTTAISQQILQAANWQIHNKIWKTD